MGGQLFTRLSSVILLRLLRTDISERTVVADRKWRVIEGLRLSKTQRTVIAPLVEAERYILTVTQLEATHVQLSGQELQLAANDELPELRARSIRSGPV